MSKLYTFYVPIYSRYFGASEGPLFNFECKAEDREHALEQANDYVKDDEELTISNEVWQFNDQNHPELGIKEV